VPDIAAEQIEAFITEGFLSYDDLTFLEPEDLAEVGGTTPEHASAIIAYAEEAAIRVEEETRAARAAEAEARAAEAAAAPAQPASPAAKLFPDTDESRPEEAKPTVESLFGPDTSENPPEEPVDAAQVLGEEAPAQPEQKPDEGA